MAEQDDHLYTIPDVFVTIARTLRQMLTEARWDIPNKCMQLAGVCGLSDFSPSIKSLNELRTTLSFLALGIYFTDTLGGASKGVKEYTLQQAGDAVDDVLGSFDAYLEKLGWIESSSSQVTLPETLPTTSVIPLLELLKYINGGDAHPEEIREEARDLLDAFDKLHPEVLTALHEKGQDDEEDKEDKDDNGTTP